MTVLTEPDRASNAAGAQTLVYMAAAPGGRAVSVGDRLSRSGLPMTRATDLADVLRKLAESHSALCVVDLADDRAAVPAIRAIRAQRPDVHILGVVDPSRPVVAAEALHAGVHDLLPWPFEDRDVLAAVANAHDSSSSEHGGNGDARGVRSTDTAVNPDAPYAGDVLFAHSAAMRQVVDLIRETAAGSGGVLVLGEAGSGREMVARAIHGQRRTGDSPFVAVDCASGTADSLEERLFGTAGDLPVNGKTRALERIARGTAIYDAQGGTLYLINVVEAAARVQARLARILRDGQATLADKRVAHINLDARTIAAEAPGIEAALGDGRLRRDLYERLAMTRIEIPPLRRRREDVPLLAVHVLRQLAAKAGTPPRRFTRSALTLLAALPWPGNGHELRDVVDAMLHAGDGPVIRMDDVLAHVRLDGIAPQIDGTGSLREAKRRFERDWISAVLMKHHGRVGDAARALGIQRTNLYRKVRQLKVARNLLARKA